jgi:hypothetical protein
MESIVINGLIGIVVFIFAVLAIGPALFASDNNRQTPIQTEEDRIISIEPVRFDRPAPRSISPRTIPGDAPLHREAA